MIYFLQLYNQVVAAAGREEEVGVACSGVGAAAVVAFCPFWAVRKMQTLQNDALRICECIRDPRGVNIDDLYARNNIQKLLPARTGELVVHLDKMSKHPDKLISQHRT